MEGRGSRAVLGMRAAVSGLILAAGCIAAVVKLSSAGAGAGQSPEELDQTLANFLGGGYKLKSDDLESQLEKYRVMRNVALAAMGHPSLTAIPTQTAAEQRKHLKKLKAKALKHLDSLSDSRGRSISKWGIEDDGADRSDGAGPGERSPSSSSGCSASDAKFGLCEDDSSDLDDDPEKQALHDKEEEVSENLRKQEKKGDMERQVQIDAINKVRLAKADKMLDKLTKDNSLINEMVHHTVKVAGMAPATWTG